MNPNNYDIITDILLECFNDYYKHWDDSIKRYFRMKDNVTAVFINSDVIEIHLKVCEENVISYNIPIEVYDNYYKMVCRKEKFKIILDGN